MKLILNKNGQLNLIRCLLNRLWLCPPTEETTLCALAAYALLGIIVSGLVFVSANICFISALLIAPLFGTWPKLGMPRASCPPILGLWKYWQPDGQKYHNLCVQTIDNAKIPPVVFFCFIITVLLESGVFRLVAEDMNKFEYGLILIVVLIGYATAFVAVLAGVILLLAGIFLLLAAIVQLFIWLHKKMCIPVIFK